MYRQNDTARLSLWLLAAIYHLGCAPDRHLVPRGMKDLVYKGPDNNAVLKSGGFDLVASGDSAVHWELKTNFDDSTYFISADGFSFAAKTMQPTVQADGLSFSARSPLGTVRVERTNKKCSDHNDAFQTRVFAPEKIYSGCSAFVFDNNLHGNWELATIGHTAVQSSQFKLGAPLLQFDLNKGLITGHDGCAYFSAPVSVVGKRIWVGDQTFLVKGSKNCAKNNVDQLNNNLFLYEIISDRLDITLNNDLVLGFRRKFGF